MTQAIQGTAGVLPSGLMSRKSAAIYLGRDPKTLANWKHMRVGPTVQMVHGRAFYVFEEVKAFVERERSPEIDGRSSINVD